MNISPSTIDRIVADVLAQLGDSSRGENASIAGTDVSGTVSPTPPQTGKSSPAKAFDVDLSHTQVLTGEMLESLSEGAIVRVSSSGVLTPSAREVIKSRALQLTEQAVTKASSAVSTLAPKLLVVTSNPETRALADTLQKSGWTIDFPGCDGDAIKAARSAVCRGESSFVAIIAPQPNRTAQRLNRTRNVLAAALTPETSVTELQAEGKWNVACFAAGRWASFRLRKTLESMAKGAAS